jgi:hypothetical protein
VSKSYRPSLPSADLVRHDGMITHKRRPQNRLKSTTFALRLHYVFFGDLHYMGAAKGTHFTYEELNLCVPNSLRLVGPAGFEPAT